MCAETGGVGAVHQGVVQLGLAERLLQLQRGRRVPDEMGDLPDHGDPDDCIHGCAR